MSAKEEEDSKITVTTLRCPTDLYQRIKDIGRWRDRSAHYLLLRYAEQGVEADEARRAAGDRP